MKQISEEETPITSSRLFGPEMALALLVAISGFKKSRFQGPPLPMALVMDIARIKSSVCCFPVLRKGQYPYPLFYKNDFRVHPDLAFLVYEDVHPSSFHFTSLKNRRKKITRHFPV